MGLESSGKSVPKILIVDDILINLEILESILEEEGYQPLCALNVQEAIDISDCKTPEEIQEKVLLNVEHKLLPKAVKLYCNNKLKIENERVEII